MTIRVWHSFSCNNSSSYRLVARFADAATARDTAAELRQFFEVHAKEMDRAMEEGNGFPNANPETALALAKQYGFAWKDVLTWGDEMLEGDEPSLAAEGEVLVVYHTYCGGFGDAIPAYLTARGAREVERETRSTPTVSVLFGYAGGNAELDAGLAMLVSQIDEEQREVEPLKTPWPTRWKSSGTAAFFRDAQTVGMVFPIAPTDLPAFKAWLAEHGVTSPSIRLCEYADEARFVAIAAARCTACEAQALEYRDPRLHDLETPQLVCTKCGGMYEVATFLSAGDE